MHRKYKWQVGYSMVYHEKALHKLFYTMSYEVHSATQSKRWTMGRFRGIPTALLHFDWLYFPWHGVSERNQSFKYKALSSCLNLLLTVFPFLARINWKWLPRLLCNYALDARISSHIERPRWCLFPFVFWSAPCGLGRGDGWHFILFVFMSFLFFFRLWSHLLSHNKEYVSIPFLHLFTLIALI